MITEKTFMSCDWTTVMHERSVLIVKSLEMLPSVMTNAMMAWLLGRAMHRNDTHRAYFAMGTVSGGAATAR